MTKSATATRICALLVALSACAPAVGASNDTESASGAAASGETAKSDTSAGQSTTDALNADDATTSDVSADGDTNSKAGSAKGDTPRVKGPRPADLPFELPVKASSELWPTCVEPGDDITLEVTTEPGAAIGYQAIYSDNGGGAAVPMGEGYGGNDRGYANDDGFYTSTWVVGLNAPSGPARADVVIGYEGEFGYDDPHFAVADENGNCDEAWLAQDEDE
jgi:hypothetical protein